MTHQSKLHSKTLKKSLVSLSWTFLMVSSFSLSAPEIDENFSVKVVKAGPPLAAAVQDDGKLVIIRSVAFGQTDRDRNGADLDYGIVRFNVDASLDQSFGIDGKFSTGPPRSSDSDPDTPADVAIQSDGKIVVVGSAGSIGSVDTSLSAGSDFGIARFNVDGSLDFVVSEAFDQAAGIGVGEDVATSVVIQSDGKIVVMGSVELEDEGVAIGVLRLNSDGSLDQSFANNGKNRITFSDIYTPKQLLLQPDGKILLIGSAQFSTGNQDFGIVRLNSNGSIDDSFGSGGGIRIAFDFGGNNTDIPNTAIVQPDGKILIVGSFDVDNQNQGFSIVRLDPDGSFDSTFGLDGIANTFDIGGFNAATFSDMALLSNGKIIIAGNVDVGGGNQDYAAIRLNANGRFDLTFGLDGIATVAFDAGGSNADQVTNVFARNDGTVMLVGSVDNDTAIQSTGIALIDSNGNQIQLLTGIAGLNQEVKQGSDFVVRANQAGPLLAATVQADGKFVFIRSVVFGAFGFFDDRDYGIVRFNADSSLDQSFGAEGKFSSGSNFGSARFTDIPTDVAVQSDGKIIMVGSAGVFDEDFAITRLNSDGSLDFEFVQAFNQAFDDQGGGIGGVDIATSVIIQSNGKIVVAGSVEVGEGGSEFGVLRLNSNGELDQSFGFEGLSRTAFDRGNAIAASATDVALQADGKIIVVGSVELDDAGEDFGILRLTSDGNLDQSFGVDGRALVAFDQGGNGIDTPSAVAVQADGKIIVVGSVEINSDDQDFGVVRLNSDGSLDSSFGIGGGITIAFDLGGINADKPSDVVIQADGKIVIVGSVALGAGNQDYAVVRLNTNGSLDAGFGVNGKTTVKFDQGGTNIDLATNVFVKEDGTLIVLGSVENNTAIQNSGIALLDSSGNLAQQLTGTPGLNLELKDSAVLIVIPPPNTVVPQHSQNEDTPTFVLTAFSKQPDLVATDPLNHQYSGSWFDPSHNGEGFLIEILENNQAVIYWFTYDKNGNQVWIVGVGSVTGTSISVTNAEIFSGGVFGADFDPAQIKRSNWGSLNFTFTDCNTGVIDYTGPEQFGSGRLNLQRNTSISGLVCGQTPRLENQAIGIERITGLWFDPSHDGEGYLIEVLDNNRAVMFWFSYDKNGNQAWIVGVGSVTGRTITVADAEIFSGGLFGPDFDPASVIRQRWGSIIFTFSDCETAVVSYTGPPEFGMGTLNLQRLTFLANYRCTALFPGS